MNDIDPQNFEMAAGDSKVLKVTVTDEAGSALPLAGTSSVVWRMARTARSLPVLSKTIADGVTIITDQAAQGEANCGRIDIRIESAESAPLDGEYFHDCHLVDATGAHSTIFYGRIFVSPNLT